MPLASVFATPIAMYDATGMEALNREITDILVKESETIPSLSHSNVGGWHSKYDLQLRPEACFRHLTDLVTSNAMALTITVAKGLGRPVPKLKAKTHMWAMVMRDGHYTVPHTHADSHWASVYYADAGDTDEAAYPDSGVISFKDPRSGVLSIPGLDLTGGDFMVNPKTGQMQLFPGWLTHYVHVYRGTRPRVSIACNVTYTL